MKKEKRIIVKYAYFPTRIYFEKDKEYGIIWLCKYKQEEEYREEEYRYIDPNFGGQIYMNNNEKIMIGLWSVIKKFK